jgi:hypothetical protein
VVWLAHEPVTDAVSGAEADQDPEPETEANQAPEPET